MAVINPDHEAAIVAFHRAAAAAGVGGDGRYARAVALLEPRVRRDLEARAEPQPPASEVSSGDKRLIPPVKPPAEAQAQAQGGGEVVVWIAQCELDSLAATPKGLKANGLVWSVPTGQAGVPLYTAPPSTPGVLDGTTYSQIEDALDRAEVACQDRRGRWLSLVERVNWLIAQPPSAPVGVEAVLAKLREWLGADGTLYQQVEGMIRTLAQQPAAVYQCPRCATSMEVDPTAKPAAVDGAMVERAFSAYVRSRGSYEGEVPPDREDIRAALIAALAAQHQEPTT